MRSSIVGKLEGFFETGTEGVIWSVYEDGKQGYDGLHDLEDGDHLKVWESASGRTVFDGRIKFDWKIGYEKFPLNPSCGQQAAMGFWVHGIQEGFMPDDWARLFFRLEGDPELRCELTKGKRRRKRR